MKARLSDKLEAGRVRSGPYGTATGLHGLFRVHGPCGCELVIVSAGLDGTGWEHVSVSTKRRTPNWQEMSWVKDLFWREDECVMQLHPAKSEYVNNHPYCLHLWRPTRDSIPMPPANFVGYKELGVLG